jgi:Family of unknown function (DUF5678)
MNDQSKQEPITVTLPTRELTKVERERRAFLRLLPQLLDTHRGQYVAIHNEQVVGTGTDRMELAMEVWRRVGGVDLYVGLVSEEPERPVRSGVVRVLE